MKVLVADDNEDAATSLAMLLELVGYEVQVASDGRSALQLEDRWRPDLAILDLNMPGLDGYAVAEALRARRGRGIVLIALSAQLTLRQRDPAASRLFDTCCSKGIGFFELKDQLDVLLEERHVTHAPGSRTNTEPQPRDPMQRPPRVR